MTGPCALGCGQPFEHGQALFSVLKLGLHGQLVNAPVHFSCFAEQLAKAIAGHLADQLDDSGEPGLDDMAAAIVARLTRRR